MASNMPPHNLKEVISGIVAQIDNPKISLEELMTLVPGPDFPTGGKIIGREGIHDAYETGRGKITMRGTTALERGKGGKSLIVIMEIPYQVNKANLAAKIESLSEEKIEGILDVRDESDREGMRLVVECHKDTNPQIVLQQLCKYTQIARDIWSYQFSDRPQRNTDGHGTQGDYCSLYQASSVYDPPSDRVRLNES